MTDQCTYIKNARKYSSVGRVGHFRGIRWSCSRCNGDTKTEDKAAAHEASKVVAGSLNTSAKDDDKTTQEHSPFTSLVIGGGPGYERAHQVADGVDGVDDTGRGGSFVDVEAEVVSVLRITIDSTHQRAIVAIDARVQCCNKKA